MSHTYNVLSLIVYNKYQKYFKSLHLRRRSALHTKPLLWLNHPQICHQWHFFFRINLERILFYNGLLKYLKRPSFKQSAVNCRSEGDKVGLLKQVTKHEAGQGTGFVRKGIFIHIFIRAMNQC